MTTSPYHWDGDNVVLSAGFHSFTLAYIEATDRNRYLLAIYGWSREAILPPQGEERPQTDGETDGAVEIPCRTKAEARALVEAMFLVRGWEILGGSND